MPTEPLFHHHHRRLLILMVKKPKPRLQNHRREPKNGLGQAKARQRWHFHIDQVRWDTLPCQIQPRNQLRHCRSICSILQVKLQRLPAMHLPNDLHDRTMYSHCLACFRQRYRCRHCQARHDHHGRSSYWHCRCQNHCQSRIRDDMSRSYSSAHPALLPNHHCPCRNCPYHQHQHQHQYHHAVSERRRRTHHCQDGHPPLQMLLLPHNPHPRRSA